MFTARIPPTATVRCTEEYAGRVRALHWRRPIAILTDTEPRMMPSTELLLGMVPFPPAEHPRYKKFTKIQAGGDGYNDKHCLSNRARGLAIDNIDAGGLRRRVTVERRA